MACNLGLAHPLDVTSIAVAAKGMIQRRGNQGTYGIISADSQTVRVLSATLFLRYLLDKID
jgi:hypothetical protein